jgi:hypothetical protein
MSNPMRFGRDENVWTPASPEVRKRLSAALDRVLRDPQYLLRMLRLHRGEAFRDGEGEPPSDS